MTGAELRAIRRSLGQSALQMGRALRFGGADDSVAVHVRRMEAGLRPITPQVAGLAYMLGWHGVPERWPDEPIQEAAE